VQFDQRTLLRIGMAAIVVIAGLVTWLRSGSVETPLPERDVTLDQQATPAGESAAPRDTSAAVDGNTSEGSAQLPVSQGDFDYYVLVLSWSPTHCSSDAGRGRDDDMQCRSGRPYGFVLHGLWPQHERGYPQSCDTSEPHEVSAENMARALKISPSENLVQHEWEKHGTCSALSQDDFFSTEIAAFSSVAVPNNFKQLERPAQTTPDEVREAFLAANASLSEESVSATCRRNELAEVWVCLDKSLKPRACSSDVRKRHCGSRRVRMLAVRGDWP
jgi:ribonuclease T2